MKYLDEYRDAEIARKIIANISATSTREMRLMEVCGTHTVAIFRSGIKNMLPPNISLLSGPGCPVCVTPNENIDKALYLAMQKDVILTTFGDMIKVPGSKTSLEKERAQGADIRVIYSALDALDIARRNPPKQVVLLGIGFETTSPTIASAILSADKEGLDNFFILAAHKLIPPAMKALLDAEEVRIDGFLCPGHVSTIIGSSPYQFIPTDYGLPCVIAGFEPLDMLQSILMAVQQIEKQEAKVEIEYRRAVRPPGNITALKVLYEVFDICDARWRGLGIIPKSGLQLKEKYRQFDAESAFAIPPAPFIKGGENVSPSGESKGCLCGEILRGIKVPTDCTLFGKVCTPEEPVGPCMVSSEGTCAAYFKYGS
ncbi:hydrogenase formation protein HypD [Candidatus Poribacteria bacterium]|nr:hydrogenase formation protein HypD [Candidatus Poribacteria bacterium]